MRQVKVKVTDVLKARPEDVYATIADYRQGHPYIIPQENLYDLQVEQGGYGEGTIIRFKSRMLGTEQSHRQRISEPEPGRVLVEQEIDAVQNVTDTFTVIPLEQGQKTHIEISVAMDVSSGFKGFIERIAVLSIFPSMLRKELKLLEAVAQKRKASIVEAGQS
jgi:hypothetical protein